METSRELEKSGERETSREPDASREREALACEGLSKAFGPCVALLRQTFSIAEGERIVVQGPSGSGKTTLLRLLAGLLDPTAGCVRERGRVVSRPGWRLAPHRRGIGMLFQGLALWPHLTARSQVELCLTRRSDLSRAERRRAAARLLEESGVLPLADRLPAQLSGGEKQRVAWARAVAGDPRILILDEPLTSLDPALKAELTETVLRHGSAPGRTLVVATHDEELARRLEGRVLRLSRPT